MLRLFSSDPERIREQADNRKRSASCSFQNQNVYGPAPKPPPRSRSTPGTFRRPRRDVGDVVNVTSPSKIFLEYVDDNYKEMLKLDLYENYCDKLETCDNLNDSNKDKSIGDDNEKVEEKKARRRRRRRSDKNERDVPKFLCKTVEGNWESQEINLFMGNDCNFLNVPR